MDRDANSQSGAAIMVLGTAKKCDGACDGPLRSPSQNAKSCDSVTDFVTLRHTHFFMILVE